MIENVIKIGTSLSSIEYEFDNANIDAGSINFSTSVDVVGAELSIDVFNAKVRFPVDAAELFSPADYDGVLTADSYMFATNRTYGDFRLIAYATPLWYYRDDVLVAKFYVRDVERVSVDAYKITAMSAIGVLDTQTHMGGFYTGQRFDAVLAELIDNAIPYTIEEDLAATPIFNWLRIGTKRKNLHELMFATGAVLTKDAAGDIVFSFLYSNDEPPAVPSNRIYYGGSVDYNAPATAAEVTEHSFYQLQSDEVVTLFDNTDGSGAANNLLVSFRTDAPVYGLSATSNLTIVESGVNYAVVSGTGILTGKKYTHTTHIIRKEVNNPATAEKTVTASEELALISAANSENVAERVLAYYSSAKTVRASIILNGEQAGRQIAFTDPYGDESRGYIHSMNVNVSSIVKSDCEIVTDFAPTGQGNNYNRAIVLTGSGNTPKIEHKGKVRLVIIHAGDGGQGGYAGNGYGHGEDAQAGGSAGSGGLSGRVKTVTVEDIPLTETVFSYHCGKGGKGGKGGLAYRSGQAYTAPENGSVGLPSAITINGTAYWSTTGERPANGVINLFTGEIYATNGAAGIGGGRGATENGGATVTDGANTWHSGVEGQTASSEAYGCGGTGGYGGGAAVGHNGGTGLDGYYAYEYYQGEGKWTGEAGQGGMGAAADAPPKTATYGAGGTGGNGGGGGGKGGYAWGGWQFFSPWAGYGGDGSDGGDGGDGCIIVYY